MGNVVSITRIIGEVRDSGVFVMNFTQFVIRSFVAKATSSTSHF